MALQIPFTVLKDFLENGKNRIQGLFLPPDDDLTSIVTTLETGLSGKHIANGGIGAVQLASGAFRKLVFTGANVTSTPVACTLTGAKVGDIVVGVTNLTDATSNTSAFESTITVADQIQQTGVVNYSAKKFDILLIAKGG